MSNVLENVMDDDVLENSWHQGELTVQKRAGTYQLMAEIGPKFIRQFMPQQHRDFFQSLSMLFIGYSDSSPNQAASISYASVLFGAVGFIRSPSETELIINTQDSMGDFNNNSVNVGDRIGLVGIEFDTKRRNRINAIVTDISQKNITVSILQSYGNCPKYIQSKKLIINRHYDRSTTASHVEFNDLVRNIIAKADTFFIASSFNDGKEMNNRGVDMSHRGGEAGFISINEDGQLLVPDYVGNGFFNTLGNLVENPIASLLFCDWQQGISLQLTVSGETLWHNDVLTDNDNDNNNEEGQQKVERTLRFTPLNIMLFKDGLAYTNHPQ